MRQRRKQVMARPRRGGMNGETESVKSKVTREMNALLRSLTKSKNNTSAKLAVIIKYKKELGPRRGAPPDFFCDTVVPSSDIDIVLFRHSPAQKTSKRFRILNGEMFAITLQAGAAAHS
jgi:hypothetical protein